MQSRALRPTVALALIGFSLLFGLLLAGARAIQKDNAAFFSVSGKSYGAPSQAAALSGTPPAARMPAVNPPGGPTPTPDALHPLPTIRGKAEQYVVEVGDTLAKIAQKYGVSVQQLIQANNLANPDIVEVGRTLDIPAPSPQNPGPAFKIIPDSELVRGPASADFDIAAFAQQAGGYLASYQEEVDGEMLSGPQVIERVAEDFSVNPRLLLAVLEYQSSWVTKQGGQNSNYPAGLRDPSRKGLYRQMAWAANSLNRGFYVWRVNGAATWLLADDSVVPIAPTINAGTAGVQQFFASLDDLQTWLQAVSPEGLFATYEALFGYPFGYAVEPLIPAGLKQPTFQLPFQAGEVWSFTGGPHAGWADGSAWAALDFAPPGDALGCVKSDAWVVAMADGVIVRTGNGEVIQDLDTPAAKADGIEQTGWVILYMHIESRDRVQPGTRLKAGDRIGHPSCEGGVSTGTHTHIGRRYSGEWVPADQDLPFVMDGWVSHGSGGEYDGYLERNGQTIEAYAGRSEANGIQR
ncbi:MAG TPA: LysM peptidoglycan-binding domain-containing protein [Anaerolineales bacterium]